MNLLLFYINKKKSLLSGKVELCVVLTVNIHIWKVKWKKIKEIYEIKKKTNKKKTQDVCLACFMLPVYEIFTEYNNVTRINLHFYFLWWTSL